jgi:hypothetical protein
MTKTRLLATLALGTAAALAGEARAAAPVARLTASRTSCVAPCAVYFDARATTDADSRDHADDLLDLTYLWDFGDPGAGSWGQGARAGTTSPHPKNVDSGFAAGHVYEQAGAYTATVTVSDGVSTSIASAVVTVSDPGARWPGASTLCIAASTTPVAGQGGCPAGAAVLRSADFDAALMNNGCHNTAKRCLFRRGDTFTVDRRVGLTSAGPTQLGAYGTGAKPRVNLAAGASGIFGFDAGNHDIRIMDLELRGNDAADSSALGIGLAGNNPVRRMLLLRLDVSHFDNQLAFRGVTDGWLPRVNVSNENAIVDCTILDGPGLGGNDFFVVWERSLFLGNRIGDKLDGLQNRRGEHILRARYTEGVVYSHNSMGLLNDTGGRIGCGDIRHIVKMVSDLANDQFPNGVSYENILADNYFSSCKGNQWDVDLGRTDSQMASVNQGQRRLLVERNHFTKRFAERSTDSLHVEGDEGMVRNNVFDLSGPGQTGGPVGVQVWNRAPVSNPPVPTRDVRVYNNACYQDAATTGNGACVVISAESTAAMVRNNLLFSPSGRSTVLEDDGVATATCGACNTEVASNPFAGATLAGILDYAPRDGGPAIDSGQPAAAVSVNFETRGVAALDGDDDGSAERDLGAFEGAGDPGTGGGGAPAAPILLP